MATAARCFYPRDGGFRGPCCKIARARTAHSRSATRPTTDRKPSPYREAKPRQGPIRRADAPTEIRQYRARTASHCPRSGRERVRHALLRGTTTLQPAERSADDRLGPMEVGDSDRSPLPPGAGPNAPVVLHKAQFGRGPTKAHTMFAGS